MRKPSKNRNNTLPGYRLLFKSGELRKRSDVFLKIFSHCSLCPWKCGVNRLKGEKGRCQAPGELKVAKALAHYGEEPVLSGTRGSGTIFFSHCHLKCCYCQNYQISQEGIGEIISAEALAGKMLSLQKQGCHNINLVSATHYLPQVIQALIIASSRGLSLPLVYNSNGYESVDTLRLLSGIVDIYLPDAKYAGVENAEKYSGAKNYPAINAQALKEMYRQVGPLAVDDNDIGIKGLIIRHLVLPFNRAGTDEALQSIRSILGSDVHISLMGQYQPVFEAHLYQEINRKPTPEEYNSAVQTLIHLGFENGWFQEPENIASEFLPDFEKSDSWN
jgi:putative pyruvate formate lyase activating enzyme